MVSAARTLAVIACAGGLCAQTPAGEPAASVGMQTPWEIAPVLRAIAAHGARLSAALAGIDAKAWVEKGAPETYARQVESSIEQARALSDTANALAANPEQLASSIELLLRIESIETMLGSIEEGLRKYETPADAQALASIAAEGGAGRDRFQKYLISLAAGRERQLQIMDQEAQRCRAVLTAPDAGKSGKKK